MFSFGVAGSHCPHYQVYASCSPFLLLVVHLEVEFTPSMTFAQLTYRESLRDIETFLRAHQTKFYHLGIRGNIARSTLADANDSRDWHIYADFAMSLIQTARKLYASDQFAVELE